MFTLNQAVKRLREIAINHGQLNPLQLTEADFSHFGYGDLWEVGSVLTDEGNVITEKFPLVWCNVVNANTTGDGFTALLAISFQVLFMDLVHKDETNERDVLSDTLLIATDYINELQDNEQFLLHKYVVDINGSLEPFTEKFDQEVSGWSMNITFNIAYSINCAVPNNP
jgi:hypothetical protein